MTTVNCDRKISNNMIHDGYSFSLVSAYSGGRQRETCFDDMRLSAENNLMICGYQLNVMKISMICGYQLNEINILMICGYQLNEISNPRIQRKDE